MSEKKASALLTTTGARLLSIEHMLRGRRVVTFADMLGTLGCSRATLKRDLKTLRDELGAPLRFDGHDDGYRLVDKWAGVAAALYAEVSPDMARNRQGADA